MSTAVINNSNIQPHERPENPWVKLGCDLFYFNNRHYIRTISKDSPVLSGVPQGTVLGPLLFIIMISDINKDILSSKIISFADDTRVYTNITQIENSDSLQTDLNYIYLWAINNNM